MSINKLLNLVLIISLLLITLSLFQGCKKKTADSPDEKSKIPVADTGPAYGDMLIDSSIGDATNLIPMLTSDSASHMISPLISDGLLKYDKDVKISPDLAESWSVSDDKLTITFNLRKGVKFHDGSDLDAIDIVATFDMALNPGSPNHKGNTNAWDTYGQLWGLMWK